MSAVRKTRRKDLVVGLGATGLSIARYLARNGQDAIYCDTREAPPGLDDLRALVPDADIRLGDPKIPAGVARVIASPGVPASHPLFARARKRGIEVVSDIELFASEAEAPFVAITGSNGKSTVTTLVAMMCEAAGRRVKAGGNLGEPALDLLTGEVPDVYVLELSSFQLQRTAHLPAAVSVLLNISADHLDWHADEAEYREAKYRVYGQAVAAVYNREDAEASRRAAGAERTISFGLDEPAEGQYGIRVVDGTPFLARGGEPLLATAELALIGTHNQANALAALAAGELAGLPVAPMLQVLTEFPGLPHRMQRVATRRGVDFVNDSKATNVAAAIASIRSLKGDLVLIAGGVGKGATFEELGAALEGRLRAAVLIGESAPAIEAALDTVKPVYVAADMDDAVERAAAFAEKGDTVLLAPACASFDMFANYGARGEAFAAAVRGLGR